METLKGRLKSCSINTATLGHRENLDKTIERVARAGFGGIAPWRHEVEAGDVGRYARKIRDHNLTVTGYCRSTYFPASTLQERQANIDANIRALHDAAELNAKCFVMVVGGLPEDSRDLAGAREQVTNGISQLLEHAKLIGVPLAIEPLHPMYAANRSVISTIEQSLALCHRIDKENSGFLGIAIDIYHCWWDPMLDLSISSAGKEKRIYAYHVSDWLEPTQDMLLDRGMMGDGIVDLRAIRSHIEQAGYEGMVEVEIFSRDKWWKEHPTDVLSLCAERLQMLC